MLRAPIVVICLTVSFGAALAAEPRVIEVPQTQTQQPATPSAPQIQKRTGPSEPQPRTPLDQPKQQSGEQQGAPDKRGTEQLPLVVKEMPRERSQEEKAEAQERAILDRKLTRYIANLDSYSKALFAATLALAVLIGALDVAIFWLIRRK